MMSASQIKKLLHIILAALLITVGLFGLVLPVLNGIIPITIGLILLSFESKYIESLLERITKKNKHVDHWYQRLAKRLKKIFGIKS